MNDHGDRLRARRRAENFPVAGLLTPADLRPAVRTLYAFARIADDIADDPALGPVERLARLDAMKAALAGSPSLAPPGSGGAIAAARDLRAELAARGIDAAPAGDFLYALALETTLGRIPDAEALLRLCRMTAAPIGRLMVALYGIDRPELLRAGAALAVALQILDHVQDCAEDYRRLDRVYLPADWLAAAGLGDGALAAAQVTGGLRAVLDRCLDLADRELAASRPLAQIRGRYRLAAEVRLILAFATVLSRRLRRGDPCAGRVGPGLGGRIAGLARWLALMIRGG